MSKPLTDGDYRGLADFRFAMRRFLAFSEENAMRHGLTPQQHQALLVIRAAPADEATVGLIAERLIMKPHSASGLVNRLEALELVERQPSPRDGRRTLLRLTQTARTKLGALTEMHREELKNLRPALAALLAQFDS